MGPRRLAALGVPALVLLAAAARAQPPGADSTGLFLAPDSAQLAATRVSFHHYEMHVPASEGWKLVGRDAGDEAISVELLWQKGDERLKLAQIDVGRQGLFDLELPRWPRAAFDSLAAREARAAWLQQAPGRGVRWLGSHTDSVAEPGRTLYRLWYGLASGDARADAYVVYLFPEAFGADGFYVRAALQMWSRPGREDVSILEDFASVLRSLRMRTPALDARVVRDGPDVLGKARLSLPFVYNDARARVLHSPHDSTRAPCWTQVEDTLAVGLQHTLLPGTIFFSLRERPPAPGERTPGGRFGKMFDRDGDGRYDLAFFSQGWARAQDGSTRRTFYAVADDDSDGRVDGVVFEDGDNDGDALVDHFVLAQDRSGGGAADRAWVLDTDIAHPVRPIPHQGPIFLFGRTSRPGVEQSDLGAEFRSWSRELARLNRAAAACLGGRTGVR